MGANSAFSTNFRKLGGSMSLIISNCAYSAWLMHIKSWDDQLLKQAIGVSKVSREKTWHGSHSAQCS